MKIIDKEETKNIIGGSISFTTGAVIVGIIVFATGILDGFFRPYKCHK